MAASNGAVEVDVVDDAGGLLGPRPAWLARQRFACWSGGPDLVGWALWGHCADDDAEAGKRMWIELARRMRAPYDFVLDLCLLDSVSRGAFERIREFANTAKPGLRRMAILVGVETAGGAIQVGLFVIRPPSYPWRSFTRSADAVAWLERPGVGALFAAIEPRVREAAGGPSAIAGLRSILSSDPGATVASAARRLACSTRSLQRLLAEHGTSFSDERDRARVVRAQDLLRDPDAKLEAVAIEIGCSDRRSLNRLFRRLTGESPADFRLRSGAQSH